MKLITLILIMFLCLAQLSLAQDTVQTLSAQNKMSNVFGITAEGGITLGYTDYSTQKINYTGKGSLEYYLPSSGKGNIGIRIFGQTGFIGGKMSAPVYGNPTNEFSTEINMFGGGIFYALSLGDAIYPWVGVGISDLWFHPKDANGKDLPNYAANVYDHNIPAYNGDAGIRIMVSKQMSINLAGGIVVATTDYLDDIKAGAHNDLLYTLTAGLSYYFGRDKEVVAQALPEGIRVDTVVITREDTVVITNTKVDTVVMTYTKPAEIKSLVLSGDANFEFNKAKLLTNAYTVLDSLVSTMKKHPEYKWEIDGYTDAIGSDSYNIRLSKQRALSVVDYLVSQGVQRSSLKIRGYGKENPIATNDTNEGRSMNRRVEIKLLTNDN